MNPKIQKLRMELAKNKGKISELQAKNRELEKQIRELEDTDIIGMVREQGMSMEQFAELFRNDLYTELGKHANEMAEILRAGISSLGYEFLAKDNSNQMFPVLPNRIIDALRKDYVFATWKAGEEESTIRLVTSWHTKQEDVHDFITALSKLTMAAC
mgnify:CR=1 FL=1